MVLSTTWKSTPASTAAWLDETETIAAMAIHPGSKAAAVDFMNFALDDTISRAWRGSPPERAGSNGLSRQASTI
jgi:hypothetical protein